MAPIRDAGPRRFLFRNVKGVLLRYVHLKRPLGGLRLGMFEFKSWLLSQFQLLLNVYLDRHIDGQEVGSLQPTWENPVEFLVPIGI